ncbi:MAG: site-specific integrase [Mycobacterium sp.]|nr:MAG: site-specific integrase [Mycobacterium sp.]
MISESDPPISLEANATAIQAAPPSRPSPAFGAYADEWVVQRRISIRTRDHYRRLLTARLLPTFADVELGRIDPAAVGKWYASGQAGTGTMRTHAYVLLRSVMESALADDLIAANPCQITGQSTSGRTAINRPATLDEVESITLAIPEAYQALVLMTAWLAMPLSELSELRRKDVDLDGAVVRVRRAVSFIRGTAVITTPKGRGGLRDVPIPPALLPTLGKHLRKHVPNWSESLLFPSVTDPDRHLSPSVLNQMFARARDTAGQPDLRLTDLRRSGLKLALKAAGPKG